MKGLKQAYRPVLQIGELPPPPPPKKKTKQTTDALFTSQAHGDQNPKDPNDKKQEDANPEECFQRFCHCSNDNPKFSKFLWSYSNDFQRIFLVQLKEEIWWFCFFIKCLLKKHNFTWNKNGSHQNPFHRWTRELNQEDTHGTKQLNQQNPKI